MKHDRLSILRAQEAARLEQEKADAFYVKAVGRSTRFRDDPTYRDKVLAFEARQTLPTSPKTIGVDPGAPGGDITTYTLGGGGAMTATGAYLVSGSTAPAPSTEKRTFQVGDRVRVVNGRGDDLPQGQEDFVAAVNSKGYILLSRIAGYWGATRFELLEAAGSTTPKPEEPKYWVCVKDYGIQGAYRVGDVRESEPMLGLWLPCDKDGWVTHDPQPDSTCPVPAGVKPEAKLRFGGITDLIDAASWQLGHLGDRTPNMFDIVAWRPVKS